MKKMLFSIIILLILVSSIFGKDRKVSITVYNNNLAVVKDQRTIELNSGVSKIKYQNVASLIDPTSVHFKSLTAPDKVSIIEQNYEYDIINAYKISEKYIDKEIVVTTKENVFSGKLLSHERDNLILMVDSGVVKLISSQNVVNIDFPEIPNGLITKPTLIWSLFNKKSGKHDTQVSYLTTGLRWHAEYVAIVKDDDKKLDLSAWVSIDNKSGAIYPDAKIKLVAGDVNRVSRPRVLRKENMYEMKTDAMAAPQFEEKAFFEYHLYTLKRESTINNNQIKQISLFSAAETKVKKIYSFESSKSSDKVRVKLKFMNSKKNGLGMPMPAGKVRVYKEDPADNSLEFIGEDMIDHTSKDEKIQLFLGNAFDIKPERNMLKRISTGKKSHEEIWQVKIRNHKETDVDVLVSERFYGFWNVKKTTHKYTQRDANTLAQRWRSYSGIYSFIQPEIK